MPVCFWGGGTNKREKETSESSIASRTPGKERKGPQKKGRSFRLKKKEKGEVPYLGPRKGRKSPGGENEGEKRGGKRKKV